MPARITINKGRYQVAPKRNRTADGIVFASKMECDRYRFLAACQQAGRISGLALQAKIPICVPTPAGPAAHVATYIADFVYAAATNGHGTLWFVEDVKGHATAVYKLKKRLIKTEYGLQIFETNHSNAQQLPGWTFGVPQKPRTIGERPT